MDHSQARQCAERFEFNRPEFYYTSSTTNDGSYSSSNIARSPDSPESPESPPNEASTSTEEFNNHTATVPQDNPHSTVTIGPNQFNCTQAATFSRIDTNDRVPASAARAVGARATNEYSFRVCQHPRLETDLCANKSIAPISSTLCGSTSKRRQTNCTPKVRWI